MAASSGFVLGIIFIALCGIALALQVGCNSVLGINVGRSLATVVSFSTGLVLLLCFFMVDVLAVGQSLPTKAGVLSVPWWGWFGGPLGAFYISCNVIFARILGAAILTAIFVTTQLCTAVVLDAMGWIGYPKRKLHWGRLLGLGLMIVGVLLVSVFRGEEVKAAVTSSNNTTPGTGNTTNARSLSESGLQGGDAASNGSHPGSGMELQSQARQGEGTGARGLQLVQIASVSGGSAAVVMDIVAVGGGSDGLVLVDGTSDKDLKE